MNTEQFVAVLIFVPNSCNSVFSAQQLSDLTPHPTNSLTQ